ncbi:MAG: glycerol-3-phosphate acyltransferase [Actinobacteria bacterium]|nr:glycerol-3-phosphate acyltransferase [Actinomycetota bacterium]
MVWLIVLAGYLSGSVPYGHILARRRGIDIQGEGSGNIGATNVLRTGNKRAAAMTLVLDAATGQQRHVLPAQEALSVGNFRFSPDGARVAIATGSTVRVYELPSEQLVAELPHRGATRDVAFSDDGRMLITASESGSGIWDLATQRQLARFPGAGSFSVAFTPDGQRIAVGGTDGAIRLYPCDVCHPIQRMLELARDRITRQLTPAERARFLHEQAPTDSGHDQT